MSLLQCLHHDVRRRTVTIQNLIVYEKYCCDSGRVASRISKKVDWSRRALVETPRLAQTELKYLKPPLKSKKKRGPSTNMVSPRVRVLSLEERHKHCTPKAVKKALRSPT